jgi:hypothetical protein
MRAGLIRAILIASAIIVPADSCAEETREAFDARVCEVFAYMAEHYLENTTPEELTAALIGFRGRFEDLAVAAGSDGELAGDCRLAAEALTTYVDCLGPRAPAYDAESIELALEAEEKWRLVEERTRMFKNLCAVPGRTFDFMVEAPGVGDVGRLSLMVREPTPQGQDILLRYRVTSWVEIDPEEIVRRGGFTLVGADGKPQKPETVIEVAAQGYRDVVSILLKLEYVGDFVGELKMRVYLKEGESVEIPAGPAGRKMYRKGSVSVDEGLHLRAGPYVLARSLGTLEKGTNVYLKGGEVYSALGKEEYPDGLVFVEVVAENGPGWTAARVFGGEEYISINDLEAF